MTWVLMVFLILNGKGDGSVMHTARFNTQAACEQAASALMEQVKRDVMGIPLVLAGDISCIEDRQ